MVTLDAVADQCGRRRSSSCLVFELIALENLSPNAGVGRLRDAWRKNLFKKDLRRKRRSCTDPGQRWIVQVPPHWGGHGAERAFRAGTKAGSTGLDHIVGHQRTCWAERLT